MHITGTSGNIAEVNDLKQLITRSVMQSRPAYISYAYGKAFTATVDDAGAAPGEYTIWLKNNSDTPVVINTIFTANVSANVVWKLHKVTGTGATAAAITPVNLNLSSGNDADVTCLGGAGGVTSLTSAGVITSWAGGVAYFNEAINFWLEGLILGKNDAIALEYDAGTEARVVATIMFHDYV